MKVSWKGHSASPPRSRGRLKIGIRAGQFIAVNQFPGVRPWVLAWSQGPDQRPQLGSVRSGSYRHALLRPGQLVAEEWQNRRELADGAATPNVGTQETETRVLGGALPAC